MLEVCSRVTPLRMALAPWLLCCGLVGGAAHAVPSPADDIACRPDGNSTDAVDVSWVDTNADNADYDLERQLVGGGSWNLVDTLVAGDCNDDDVCELTDPNAFAIDNG